MLTVEFLSPPQRPLSLFLQGLGNEKRCKVSAASAKERARILITSRENDTTVNGDGDEIEPALPISSPELWGRECPLAVSSFMRD